MSEVSHDITHDHPTPWIIVGDRVRNARGGDVMIFDAEIPAEIQFWKFIAAAVNAYAPPPDLKAKPRTASQRHNEITRRIMALLLEPVREGGREEEILIILESVFMGTFLALVKLGGDKPIFDAMVERISQRLARQRLEPLPPAGRA